MKKYVYRDPRSSLRPVIFVTCAESRAAADKYFEASFHQEVPPEITCEEQALDERDFVS